MSVTTADCNEFISHQRRLEICSGKRHCDWFPEWEIVQFSHLSLEGEVPCSQMTGEARRGSQQKWEGPGTSVPTETRFPGGYSRTSCIEVRASFPGRGCNSPACWPLSCPWSVLVRRERYSTHSIIKYSQAKPCLDPHFWITDLLMGWLRELNHLVFGKIGNV